MNKTLRLEAAEWFVRLRDDDITDAEYLEWQQWLASSEGHAAAFARAEQCWAGLDPVSELSDRVLEQQNFFGSSQKIRTGPRRFMPLVASIAASVLIMLSAGIYFQMSSAPESTTYQTARAEHRMLQLEDGSKISLGARSIVSVNYSDEMRQITLVRGEAVFDVAKNKARPFVVQVGKGTVTAVGTKFNIHSSKDNVTVTVLEGIVEVNPAIARMSSAQHMTTLPRIVAGKAVSYSENGVLSDVVEANLDAAVSWEKGLLVRVDTPLASVIEDVNRYSTREIIIGDPSLKDISFTGTVLSDGIDNWLRGLSVAYPIKVVDSGQDAILLLKKNN